MSAQALVCVSGASPGLIVFVDGRPLPECRHGTTKEAGIWIWADVAMRGDVQLAVMLGAAGLVIGLVCAAVLVFVIPRTNRVHPEIPQRHPQRTGRCE